MAPRNRNSARHARERVADVTQQLAALRSMTVAELRERYLEVFDEPTRSRNKDWLFKKIAWRIQELAEGGLSDQTLARIDELGGDVPVRWRQRRSQTATPTDDTPTDDDTPARDPGSPRRGPCSPASTRASSTS